MSDELFTDRTPTEETLEEAAVTAVRAFVREAFKQMAGECDYAKLTISVCEIGYDDDECPVLTTRITSEWDNNGNEYRRDPLPTREAKP